jgi:hypothetical protein
MRPSAARWRSSSPRARRRARRPTTVAARSGPPSRLAEVLRAELYAAARREEEADRAWAALWPGPPAESSVALRLAMLRARTEGPDAALEVVREARARLPGEPSLVTLELLIALDAGRADARG